MATANPEPLVDAALDATRVLVAISVRSLAATGDVVTVSQLRVLVFVGQRGDVNVADVAEELGVHPSNATRVVERLTRAGLLSREPDPHDRRRLVVGLTAAGRDLMDEVDGHRRAGIEAVLARVAPEDLAGAERVWRAFATAGGEGPTVSGRG